MLTSGTNYCLLCKMAAYPVQDISYWILKNLGYLTRKSKRNASFMTFQILTGTHSLFSHGYKDSELTLCAKANNLAQNHSKQ